MPSSDPWCTPAGCPMCTTPDKSYWAIMNASWLTWKSGAQLTDEEIEADRGRPHP